METQTEQRERKKRQIRMLFLEGKRMTAIQINEMVNTGDARKRISELRREGFPIVDSIVDKTSGTKVYWLDREAYEKKRQLSLFDLENS